jgi:hypothetical protein
VAGALSGVVHGLLGVDNPSTVPYDAQAEELKRQRQIAGGQQAQNYAQENNLAAGLGRTIAGTAGPSVAQTQLQQGLDTSNSSMLAAGAGSSGVNSVLARYQARQQQGEQAAQMQQQAALLRAHEVAQAQQQLAQLRAAMAAQSIGLYGTNLTGGLNYDTLSGQMGQANAQRDTVLGAAGLSGLSQLGAAAFSSGGGKGQ